MRCELHTAGPLGNQCPRGAVLTVQVIVGVDPGASEWTAAACSEHAWEASAIGAHEVTRLRGLGAGDARLVAYVEEAGEQLLALLREGIEVGYRWPLAKPWARR
jgi:hypothetical protein